MARHGGSHRLQGLGRAVRSRGAARVRRRGRALGARDRRDLRSLPALAPHRGPFAGGAPVARRQPASAPTAPLLGTSVLTPTLRYHPSVIAQAFGTLACLSPGRVFLGVGTGEAMNETPVTGGEFPGRKERRLRLAEAIELIRLLWTERARGLRRRVVPHPEGHGLRPPGRAGADLRGRVGAAGRQARGPCGRRLHLHERQGRSALRRAAGQGRGGRRGRPAATRPRSGA